MTLFLIWLLLAIFGLRFFAMIGRMDREGRGEELPRNDAKTETPRPIGRRVIAGR